MKVVIYPKDRRSVTAKDIHLWAKRNKCDLVEELHFNAVGNPQAHGYETLTDYHQYDSEVIEETHKALVNIGWRDRGIKPCNGGGGRRLQNPRLMRSIGIQYMLIEMCFISNRNDMEKYYENIDTIPSVIYNTAKENGVKVLGIVYGHGGNDVGARGIDGKYEAVEIRKLDFENIKESVLDMDREELEKLIDSKIAVKMNDTTNDNNHWALDPMDKLRDEGIYFKERRFDSLITRGEVFQIAWQVVDWVKKYVDKKLKK